MHAIRFRDPYGTVLTGEWDGDRVTFADRSYSEDEVDVLPPCEPTKILNTGLNYESHLLEDHGMDVDEFYAKISTGEIPEVPVIFSQGPNAMVGHGDAIRYPSGVSNCSHSVELVVVIAEQCRNVPAEEAMEYVAGYSCGNDVTNRNDVFFEIEGHITQWIDFFRAKSHDVGCPFGPVVASPEDVPEDARIELRLNGTVKQRDSLDNQIFDVPTIIEKITAFATLEPGDVIFTGSPGVAVEPSDGDVVECEIEGVGTLENTVEIPQ